MNGGGTAEHFRQAERDVAAASCEEARDLPANDGKFKRKF